jgi:hypothetical protein
MAFVIHHSQYVALFHDNSIWRVIFVGKLNETRVSVFNEAERSLDRIYSKKSLEERERMKNRLLVVRAREAIEKFPDLFREREEPQKKDQYGRGQVSHNPHKKGEKIE